MNPSVLRAGLLSVSAYQDLLRDPVMTSALRLLSQLSSGRGEKALRAYTDLYHAFRSDGSSSLGEWLADALRYEEGPYPALAEQGGSDPVLESAAEYEISVFSSLASVDCREITSFLEMLLGEEYQDAVRHLPCWTAGAPFSFESLTRSYRQNGTGDFARYRAFVWENGTLIPVPDPDCPTEEELLGYDRQREEVAQNTRALLSGKAVNNILLYGESGTGKSATVKNLLTLPGMENLRIIEADKENLSGLSSLMRILRGRKQKFIIFIDDLAFDRDDSAYSALKTILEGGVERHPDNVAVYATSNRRHLVRQTLSERAGDEMDLKETIREKTSLAERFGIRILFQSLSKQDFFRLVDQLADRSGISMDREELHTQAAAWSRFQSAQTPRSACQFILSLTAG